MFDIIFRVPNQRIFGLYLFMFRWSLFSNMANWFYETIALFFCIFRSPYNYIKQVCIFTSNCGLEIKFCICWCLASNFIYIRTDGSRWMTLALAMYCTRKYLPQKTIKSTWHWSCVGGKLTIIIVFIHLFVSVKKDFTCSR